MKRIETWAWVGCPAGLLRILAELNFLVSQPLHEEKLQEVLHNPKLEEFSCLDWAVEFPEKSRLVQRHHVACAYKDAIYIYGSRAFGKLVIDDMISLALRHLKEIQADDSHFKGTTWPAFVVGAEAQQPEERLFVARLIQNLYGLTHMTNIRRALLALQRIWDRPSHVDKSWIDYSHGHEDNLLVL